MSEILIIDDQPHMQELFSEELIDEGHRIASVKDAKSARGYLRDSKPDLVLLELYLNGFEGWDILHDIKIRDPSLPVLIVTAYDNYADDPRLSEADGYMVKDFGAIAGLRQKITDLLTLPPLMHQIDL